MSLKSVDEILDYAITREEEAEEFYLALSKDVKNPALRKLLEQFSKEERGHKSKLKEIKAGKMIPATSTWVVDLKIADYSVDIEPTENMNYQDVILLAMKREKVAFKLYTDLAEKTDDENLKNIFHIMAQEEARHKLRFEVEYDEHVLNQN